MGYFPGLQLVNNKFKMPKIMLSIFRCFFMLFLWEVIVLTEKTDHNTGNIHVHVVDVNKTESRLNRANYFHSKLFLLCNFILFKLNVI